MVYSPWHNGDRVMCWYGELEAGNSSQNHDKLKLKCARQKHILHVVEVVVVRGAAGINLLLLLVGLGIYMGLRR